MITPDKTKFIGVTANKFQLNENQILLTSWNFIDLSLKMSHKSDSFHEGNVSV